jgi:hypothetical protein
MAIAINRFGKDWLAIEEYITGRAESALDTLATPGTTEQDTADARATVAEAINLLEEVYGDSTVVLSLKVYPKT